MGILITNREYTNQFRAETTSWLLGNVGDRIDLKLNVEVSIVSASSYSNPIESDGTDQLTRTTGSFLSDGFAVGTSIAWSSDNNGTPFSGTGTITMLTPTTMRVGSITGTFPTVGAYPFTDGTNTNGVFTVTSTDGVQSFAMKYNLIANSDLSSNSVASLIDGTEPTFVYNGLSTTFVPDNLIRSSFQSGLGVFSATIEGTGLAPNGAQTFEIILSFLLGPLYGSNDDFVNDTAPSFLFDTESLTDVFEIAFLPQQSNPNIRIATTSSAFALLGNVGWFDENYNGNANNYSILGVEYTNESSIQVASIQKDANTNFAILIDQPNNTATSTYRIGFAFVPNDQTLLGPNLDDYKKNILYNGFGDLVLNQSSPATLYSGETNSFGAKIDVQFNGISAVGDNVTITGQFQPNALFSDYFDSIDSQNWNYIVWVSLADESLTTQASDRVTLLADYNQIIEQPTQFVLGDVFTEFLNHAQSTDYLGSNIYLGSSEDEILANSFMFLDTAKNEFVDSISFVVEGFNTVTGETFEAERYTIDATVFGVDASGVQALNYYSTRGFQMASGVDKNIVLIERFPAEDVGTKVAYSMQYAFRFRYEDWIRNANVPSDLIDTNELLDGQNQKWSSKDSFSNDWRLRFSVETVLNENGVKYNTKNTSSIFVRDYEESDIWDGTITHFNESGATSLYTGTVDGIRRNAILPDQPTLIQADFDLEDIGGDVGDIADYYGVIRLEIYQGAGIFGIEMISTVLDNVNKLLYPVNGETKCKIEKISTTKIRLTALIDNTYLDTSKFTYKSSARIGYKNFILPGIYGRQYGTQYA